MREIVYQNRLTRVVAFLIKLAVFGLWLLIDSLNLTMTTKHHVLGTKHLYPALS